MYFCITGTGRCGTNLLRSMLNAHPSFYVHNETHWIPKMFEFFGLGDADVDALIDILRRTYFVTGKPVMKLSNGFIIKEFSGRQRMKVAEFCDIIGNSLARRNGKIFWADKTPDYGPYLQTLQLLWPQCRIIHVIRNGKAAALSMSNHPGFQWMASAQEMWWVPASFNHYFKQIKTVRQPQLAYMELWYWRLLRIQDEATRLTPGSYLEIKFEELVERPGVTLKTIAGFLDIPETENWIAEATNVIDIKRVHWHAREISNDGIKPAHQELLWNLGYD